MNHPLPTWIERLLGIAPGPGEGTVWSLEHAWNWAPWVTLLFLVLAETFVVAIYLREGRQASKFFRMTLAHLRMALVLIVLFMLAQYALSLHKTGLPYVAVLLDDSASMNFADSYDDELLGRIETRLANVGLDEPSRWNLARAVLGESDGRLLRRLERDYKLRFYYLTGARPSQSDGAEALLEEIALAEPTGELTRLGSGIRAVLDDLRGSAPAALVLLSDGINTDGPSLADATTHAQRKGVPLFTIGLGSDAPVRDLELRDLLVDEVVFVDDLVLFDAKLVGTGFEGRDVRIILRREDRSGVLAETTVQVGPDGQSQSIRLAHQPTEEGQFDYVVEVEALDNELQASNNRQARTIQVHKEKIRVLLVQAYPSYEFRYLENMLSRDTTIELNTVLQDADLEYAQQDASALAGFPVRRDDLFQYDAIILGDVNPAALNESMMEDLVDFLDQPTKGGALIFVAGPKYMPTAYRDTPLARVMPFDPGRVRLPEPNRPLTEPFVPRPTELGLAGAAMQLGETPSATRSIWENLPPLYWMVELPELKPGARVLAEHPTLRDQEGRPIPLVVMQYVGAGKVLFHATDETWRWRWRLGDAYFARYWVQTIRSLCRSKLSDSDSPVTLEVDRREYRRGESVRFRVRFADERVAPSEEDGVTLAVEQEGRQTRRIQLHRGATGRGTFEGVLSRPSAGDYHAWMALPTLDQQAPAIDFSVLAPQGELERIRRETAAMTRAAEQTGGRFYTFDDAWDLLDDLPAGTQVPVESLPPKPLWNTWPVLALFLTLLIAEWVLRKLAGMV